MDTSRSTYCPRPQDEPGREQHCHVERAWSSRRAAISSGVPRKPKEFKGPPPKRLLQDHPSERCRVARTALATGPSHLIQPVSTPRSPPLASRTFAPPCGSTRREPSIGVTSDDDAGRRAAPSGASPPRRRRPQRQHHTHPPPPPPPPPPRFQKRIGRHMRVAV